MQHAPSGVKRGFYTKRTGVKEVWIYLGGKNKRLTVFINQAFIKNLGSLGIEVDKGNLLLISM